MPSSIIPTTRRPAGGDTAVDAWITPVIERDFKARNVFPMLRAEHASLVWNGSGHCMHCLTIKEAEALLQDVEQQYTSGDAQRRQRGLGVAYGSLLRGLTRRIKHAKGLWNDPGQERQTPSYLRLVVDNSPAIAPPEDLFKLRGPHAPGETSPA